MQSSPQDPLTRFLPKTAHRASSQGGSNDSHWKWKRQGGLKSLFFLFFFTVSFCICIGKWDANASFDVSKSFLRSWSGRGDLSRLGGRVLVRRDVMLHMCCTVEVTIQLRRRPWLQTLSVLLQLTSPAFTVSLPSPSLTSPLNYPPVLTPVTNLPTPARPTLDPLGPSAPPAVLLEGFKPHRPNQQWALWHQLLWNTLRCSWCRFNSVWAYVQINTVHFVYYL